MKIYFLGNNYTRSLLLGVFLCGVFGGCKSREKPAFPTVGRTDFPSLEMRDSVHIEMVEGNQKAWVLKTDNLVKNLDVDLLVARPVNLVIYDSLGRESAWLEADSGSTDENVTILHVWGHVYARARDGASVKTDSLVWQKRHKDIRTDGFVKVVSQDGDTLTGDGFISDDRLKNWQILNNVRTVIPNIEERMDTDQPFSNPFGAEPSEDAPPAEEEP